VVIAAAEGNGELALLDPSGGATTFLRAAELVLASDGRTGRRLDLSPHSVEAGLGHAGRIYSGRFVVEARLHGGLRLINAVEREDYVEGVVAAEIALWSAEPAELAAQAVCVRTYALGTLARRRQLGPDPVLLDSTLDQAYRGRHRPGDSERARLVAQRLREAVRATTGDVLVRDGELEDARFHAACGGNTADLSDVFSEAGAGPRGVTCPPCTARAAAEHAAGRPASTRPLGWERTFSAAELSQAARTLELGTRLTSLAPGDTNADGRWLTAQVRGSHAQRRVPLDELRAAFGPAEFKSSRVTFLWPRAHEPITGGLTVRGLGRGHGVGLCQEGARDLARAGWSAWEILHHYYPGAHVERRA
jgi:stage II sporulation protein D (peptidoglycan lytic transglycosylase)